MKQARKSLALFSKWIEKNIKPGAPHYSSFGTSNKMGGEKADGPTKRTDT